MGFREESLHWVVDRFARACRDANIPLIYQSNRRSYVGDKSDRVRLEPDRLKWLVREMAYALDHPGVNAYQLYETANFTCLDAAGEFRGSDEVRDVVRRFGFAEA